MKIGILTFYCSDNYGAMLQAYGLMNFVKKNKFRCRNCTLCTLLFGWPTLVYTILSF